MEVYHEEGKADGLDQYQLRDFQAIERHIVLVATVYSLLRVAQHDPVLSKKLQQQLKLDLEGSPAFWRRATQAQSLWSLALFLSAGLAQGQILRNLMIPLLRAVCAARVIEPITAVISFSNCCLLKAESVLPPLP